jgi:hypothetical protein
MPNAIELYDRGSGAPHPFPPEALTTHPADRRPAVIADANALIADSIRRSRGLFNIMPFLAERKLITLLTAEHIDQKVYARLPDACSNASADLAAATDAYETVHRPLLRLVRLGDVMRDDPRVAAVALADDEDVAVAQLGVLLAPALVLTRDPHLLDAGIGVRQWADALVLMKELIELDELMWGATHGIALAGAVAWSGVAALARLLQRSKLALGIAIGLAIAAGVEFRRELRTVPKKLKDRGSPLIEAMFVHTAAAFERRQLAEQRVQATLVRPHKVETLDAMVARVLVQHDEPLRGDEIHARLPPAWCDCTVAHVMSVLRGGPPFELTRGRGWKLGHSATIVRRAVHLPTDRTATPDGAFNALTSRAPRGRPPST